MKKKSQKTPGQQAPKLTKKAAELNLLIRAAALTLDPLARLEPLADKSGLSSAGIRLAIRRGYFTAGQACALELAVGAELLPKEKLCPEKFAK